MLAASEHLPAGLIVCLPVLVHVWTAVDARELDCLQVDTEEEEEILVVDELGQALQRELVQVVEYFENVQLCLRALAMFAKHNLRVDYTAEIENELVQVQAE